MEEWSDIARQVLREWQDVVGDMFNVPDRAVKTFLKLRPDDIKWISEKYGEESLAAYVDTMRKRLERIYGAK